MSKRNAIFTKRPLNHTEQGALTRATRLRQMAVSENRPELLDRADRVLFDQAQRSYAHSRDAREGRGCGHIYDYFRKIAGLADAPKVRRDERGYHWA